MIHIHHIDDDLQDREQIREICENLTRECCICFQSFHSASNYLDSLVEIGVPDILLCDIDFTHCESDRERFGEKANIAGEMIIRAVHERDPRIQIAYFTGQFDKDPEISNIYDELLEEGIIKGGEYRIQKAFVSGSENCLLRKNLPLFLQRAAQLYLDLATIEESEYLNDLCEKCYSGEIFLVDLGEVCIRVGSFCGKLKHLFIGYWGPDENEYYGNSVPEDIVSTLQSLTRPELSLAFSETFGIWGVKQITHLGGMYYYLGQQLHMRIQDQITRLNRCLSKIGLDEECIIEPWERFQERFDTIQNSRDYDDELKKIRENSFQFKMMPIKEKLADMANDMSLKLNSSNLDIMYPDAGWKRFEINFPIHIIFAEQFSLLLQSITSPAKGANVRIADLLFGAYEACNDIRNMRIQGLDPVRLTENYLIIRHSGNRFSPNNFVGKDPNIPTFIRSFHSREYRDSGKYYVAVRFPEEEKFQLFNCTREMVSVLPNWDTVFLGREELSNNHPLKTLIQQDSNNVTYHIFVFLAWRQ